MSRLDRQQFLGTKSDELLFSTTAGFVGLGGGGSHLVQQAAHMGIGGYVLSDEDVIDYKNTQRLIGGKLKDVENEMPKVEIASRLIRGLQPDARITAVKDVWQNATADLKHCDIIFGAVDTYKERDELERFSRRYLISYIDIGMDVHELEESESLVAGQVILSTPGNPCLRCCNIVTEEHLRMEANQYGALGGRHQIVWANGILASTAISIATRLISPWNSNRRAFEYLEYDGNNGTVTESRWVKHLEDFNCDHHPATEVGDPLGDIRQISFGR